MTERFFLDRNEIVTWIRDKQTWEKLKTDQQVIDKLNEQDQRIRELEQELFSERVSRLDERLGEYGGPNDKQVWEKEFGMSEREAKKKAGYADWEFY